MKNKIEYIVREAIRLEGTYNSAIDYVGLSQKQPSQEGIAIDIITTLKTQDEKRAFGKLLGKLDFSETTGIPLEFHQWTPEKYTKRFGEYTPTVQTNTFLIEK